MENEKEAIKKLSEILFNFYFEEKGSDEIYDKFSGKSIKKVMNKKTLKEHYLEKFYALIKYFFNIFKLQRNVKVYEKIKSLFEFGEEDIDKELLVFASMSYGLIEYNEKNNKLILSRRINQVLEKFIYNKKKRTLKVA
ncbi:MAG: hypothetical protein QW412_01570 [Candidatus Aenigmatarchaeota archaeon]